MKAPVVVLGAGPAGIGAGIALQDQGLVLDQGAQPGGLCRTFELDGAVFDLGGHSFHTPHPEIRELVFQALDMFEQPRQARCYFQGALIPYPFQAHFREVPDAAVVEECAAGLRGRLHGEGARDFEDYLRQRYGPGIARHFLLPYNRKLWGGDLRRLAVDWTSERMAAPVNTSEPFAERGGRRTPLQHDTNVAYPARGGFGDIMKALARRLPNLHLAQAVARIDPLRRELVTSTGKVFLWHRLVSTLPLDRLVALLPELPPTFRRAANSLEALPLALVLVVCEGQLQTPIQRVYSAGSEIPAHKIVLNHNSSPYLRSLPRHGILAEVARPDPGALLNGDLERQVVRGLCTLGLLRSPSAVRATKAIHVPRAYPVPTADRNATVRSLTDWLAERAIYCVGRFGEWAYINADEALYRGLKLGRQLLSMI
jgi:protoporphyrinogen oxidase